MTDARKLRQSSAPSLPERQGRPSTVLAVALVLAAATALVYLPSLSGQFLSYDDNLYVQDNPHVHALSWHAVVWACTQFHAGNWHPLTWISHALDCSLYGLDRPWGHHLTSIFLHAANSVLLLFVLRRLTGRLWSGAAVAALFALHPIHVESVAWIAERKDVLCALFSLLALWAYAAYAARPSLVRYLLIVLAFGAALMSKPMAVTLPFVLMLLDWWPLKRFAWRSVLEKLPLLAMSIAGCAVTLLAQRAGGAIHSFDENPLRERLLSVPTGYLFYLYKTVWPAPGTLQPLYPMPSDGGPSVTALTLVAAMALILFLTVVAVLQRRRWPYLLVGWLWFLGMLVPVWNTVQVGARFIADRYTYLPLVGIFLAVVWLLDDLSGDRRRLRRVVAVASLAVVLVLASLTVRQQRVWHDTVALWQSVTQAFPQNPLGWSNLGRAVWKRQGPDREDGVAYARQATVLKPDWVAARVALGEMLFTLKRYDEVIAEQQAALAVRPDAIRPRYILAAAFQNKGDWRRAVDEYLTVLSRQPNHLDACRNLAICYDKLGNVVEAAKYRALAAQLARAETPAD